MPQRIGYRWLFILFHFYENKIKSNNIKHNKDEFVTEIEQGKGRMYIFFRFISGGKEKWRGTEEEKNGRMVHLMRDDCRTIGHEKDKKKNSFSLLKFFSSSFPFRLPIRSFVCDQLIGVEFLFFVLNVVDLYVSFLLFFSHKQNPNGYIYAFRSGVEI